MRSGALLMTLLAAALLAGCTSTSTPPADDPADGTPPTPQTETDGFTFTQPASANTPAGFDLGGREFFTVPDGASRMVVEAEWSCVTMCPLEVSLVDAAGEVQASATGDFDVALEVAEPPAGTWEFQWRAGQDASVGSMGEVRLAFEMQA